MTALLAALLVVHALIHVLGVAKAFSPAALPQLTQPVSPLAGSLWLTATLLFLASAALLFAWPRGWWAVAACAVVVSTAAIVPSWTDAKFGMLANMVVITAAGFGLVAQGPASLRAGYERDVDRALSRPAASEPVIESDLVRLPIPVQQYLRRAGVVGLPRVRNFRARMHGRIRNGTDGRWMPLAAEQYNVVDPSARFFFIDASMFALPVQVYHRFEGRSATMRVRAAGLVPVGDVSGNEMNQAETVTLFNDMCVMAPATLIDPAIAWEPVNARTARASFTRGGLTIRAELWFNAAGELTNFWSDDRYQVAPDGGGLRRLRWSTPLGRHQAFGPVRLASHGEARWHEREGDYAYIELTIDDVQYNVESR
jgi:Family of unknown function (DUF6544)